MQHTETQKQEPHTDTNNDILMLSVYEVADRLGISRKSVYRKIEQGALKKIAKKVNWNDAKMVFASKMIELGKMDELDLDKLGIENNNELVRMNIEKLEISIEKQRLELEILKKDLVSMNEIEYILNTYLNVAKKQFSSLSNVATENLIGKGLIEKTHKTQCKNEIDKLLHAYIRTLINAQKGTLDKDKYKS